MQILTINFDTVQAAKINDILEKSYGQTPDTATSLEVGYEMACEYDEYDLILIARTKQDTKVTTLIQTLRDQGITTPIALIADNSPDPAGRISSLFLDAGADGYLNDPIDDNLLPARINSITNRVKRGLAHKQSRMQIGQITLNLENKTLTRDQNAQKLNGAEFACMHHLIRNLGTIIPYNILRNIAAQHDSNVMTTLNSLEQKITQLDPKNKYLITYHSKGYSLEDPEAPIAKAYKDIPSSNVIYPPFKPKN